MDPSGMDLEQDQMIKPEIDKLTKMKKDHDAEIHHLKSIINAMKSKTAWEDEHSNFNSKFVHDFQVTDILEVGRFGCVFEAINLLDEWKYAVKRIAVDARDLECSLREVRVHGRLDHPGIVRYHSTWAEQPPTSWQLESDAQMLRKMQSNNQELLNYTKSSSFIYIQMQLCNYSLEKWLSENREERDLSHMKLWFKQMVWAVEYMHENRIIHRNLKPSNILFAAKDHIKITGFDLAIERRMENGVEISSDPDRIGNPLYMSPEQKAICGSLTSKSDVFTLGLIFVEQCVAMENEEKKKIFDNYRDGIPNAIFEDSRTAEFVDHLANTCIDARPSCLEILNAPYLLDDTITDTNRSAPDKSQSKDTVVDFMMKSIGESVKSLSLKGAEPQMERHVGLLWNVGGDETVSKKQRGSCPRTQAELLKKTYTKVESVMLSEIKIQDFIPLNISFEMQFQVPARLAHHYSTRYQRLGTGTYGTVLMFKSKQRDKPDIAVKYFTDVFRDLSWANLAYRELNLLNNIRHDNVVRGLGAYGIYGESGELQSVYHITAYCGRNLRDIIENDERYSMKQLKSMMSDLLRACKYLNSAGIVHRDVKPENMCIDDNWKLTLLDFGHARVIDRKNQMTGERGSHWYMPVEMMMGWNGNYDEKVDVWSIGAILCEMLTGQVFFQDDYVKHPIEVAIKKLGPMPKSVLDQIGNEDVRKRFSYKSQKALFGRTDFSDYLLEEGLPWLDDDVRRNKEQLVDFIDHTLQFAQELRMSVDSALAHPLFKEVRDVTREVIADTFIPDEQPLPYNKEEAMAEVKRRIREEIDAAPKFLE
ncbi:hypothetical protein PENTCL1PPCAC_8693 [Pristionchus entomophagus]|uniref:Protein kinase domain-containing protein n=1 Tax=Pristionchus entomophagus TaxID=358040 RepID=A0AAV5T103_9BILA|nr:hypothetical protein PENTCL1PPCAC_8693 [Pristionchus entomophagus]